MRIGFQRHHCGIKTVSGRVGCVRNRRRRACGSAFCSGRKSAGAFGGFIPSGARDFSSSCVIRRLTDGLGELEQGSATLQAGRVVFRDNVQTFAAKMGKFKEKGIDEIDKKAGSLPEAKTILDTMSDLAKKDASFTGVGEGFQAKYRIVEKIK